MSRSAERWQTHARVHLPWIAVTLLGLAILWPVPLGHMPLSADHTVHLTRIWMHAEALASGQPRGWSPVWFFGTPVGDLYPVLGDLVVVAVKVLGLGLLDWAQAYAIGFTLVFVSQGWAMLRLGKVAGAAPWAGVVGAALVLCDAGAYREGGWIYTVSYGVWPQALATTFTWLAIAELAVAIEAADARAHARAIVRGALCVAAAMLAHPVSLPVLAIVAVVAIVVVGVGGRRALAEVVVAGGSILALGLALAAWWFVPMTLDRGWMVSYGWLWLPLERMIGAAMRGHLAQNVPVAVTVAVALGIVAVAVVGSRPARLFTAAGLALWAWTSADTLWSLRLDLVAPSSTQVQWQRFLVAAKPGLFFAAGYGVFAIVRGGVRLWPRRRPAALAVWLAGAAFVAWVARDQVATMRKAEVGTAQLEPDPEDPELAGDYAALREHLAAAWAERDDEWRLTVVAPRNSHWFMDMPVTTGVALYKQGFTPGDNFVHKPEAGTPALLDLLGVRYVVTRKRGSVRDADVVATFGSLKLWERRSWTAAAPVRVHGQASVEIVDDDLLGEGLVVQVTGSGPDDRLVFPVGGYPRWDLVHDGEVVEWFEVPAIGDEPIATQAERRAGLWRGGKANGDDGTEPTLLAAAADDGVWQLRYRIWRARDVVSALVSVLATLVGVTLVWPRPRRDGVVLLARLRAFAGTRLPAWLVPVLAVLVLALAIQRCRSGTADEEIRAIGWVDRGLAPTQALRAGPLKTDMLVRPAVVWTPRRGAAAKPATATFPGVVLAPRLTGWFALDDDAAKLAREGNHRFAIEARPQGADAWMPLHETPVRHEPGRHPISVATGELAGQRVDLRVRIDSEGEAPPTMGFDLDLGAQDGR